MSAGGRIGIDAGASLTKVVHRHGGGEVQHWFAAGADDALLAWVREREPERVGLTGGGGRELAEHIATPSRVVAEFEAWGAGADHLLARSGEATPSPYLLASVGTGTSAILVRPGQAAERAGGCALGGGTLVGLGRLLLGTAAFDEIMALASGGDRSRGVDLEIADVYPEVPRGFTAANFGGPAALAGDPAREDVAHALAVLVGENVAILCCSLAAQHGVDRVVFGGSTLRDNPASWEIIERMAQVRGITPVRLENGEYAGALGALELSEGR